MLEEIGVSAASAIMVDVGVVIFLFVPSLMAIAQKYNWWPGKVRQDLPSEIPHKNQRTFDSLKLIIFGATGGTGRQLGLPRGGDFDPNRFFTGLAGLAPKQVRKVDSDRRKGCLTPARPSSAGRDTSGQCECRLIAGRK